MKRSQRSRSGIIRSKVDEAKGNDENKDEIDRKIMKSKKQNKKKEKEDDSKRERKG